MPFSGFTLISIGTAFFAGVYTLAQALLGSLLLGGNIYFDTTNNTNPAICVNTGCVIQAIGGQTSTVLTNTGSRQTYTSGYLATPGSVTGGLIDFRVDFVKLPVGTALLTCHTVSSTSLTATGDVIFKYKLPRRTASSALTGSGMSIVASGSQLGTLLPRGGGARCWFSTAPGVDVEAKIRALVMPFYVP